MTTFKVNAIEPEGATTNLAVGASGQNITIGADSIKTNTLKDAGGNVLFTSNGSGVLSSVSGFGGAQTLISSVTASATTNISFTTGITSMYKEYVFEYINIHPATADADFHFQVNASGESGFNESITSTAFRAYIGESDNSAALSYVTSDDQGSADGGTGYQRLIEGGGLAAGQNDASCSGTLHLYNPANVGYVKNFIARGHSMKYSGGYYYSIDAFFGGYFNVAAAITQVDFKFSSGNIDAGIIKMYGIK